jgi:hypothetical protein
VKAQALPLLQIFQNKIQLEVPLFQRQYVWNREQQWEPLWEDISRKLTEYLDGRKDAPVHFLGAMVLDQQQTPTGHVQKRQVIDGQQRLTTLQIFLAAFRDFCRTEGYEEMAKECDGFALNTGMMADKSVEQFKVWPTQLDRSQFQDVLLSLSRDELLDRYPEQWRKWARKPEPRPQMVEAYLYFYDQIDEFFKGSPEEPPIHADVLLQDRLDECFQALKNALQVVVVDLEPGDDAQVIFETLNARGQPLLPADLLRNFIFLRASRQGEPQEELYTQFWARFDDEFWRKEMRQGRLSRPRSDIFMQHFLASRQGVDIPIKHLFVEYKYWIERKRPFATVREELTMLARQGDDFRRLLEPRKGDPLYHIATFLESFDMSTMYPLLLFLLNEGSATGELAETARILESYVLRRAVCNLTIKNYNRIFLGLIKWLGDKAVTSVNVKTYLSGLKGDSGEWPRDTAFGAAWQSAHVYHALNNPKVVYILGRLSNTYLQATTEALVIDSRLTVEHLLPQHWETHWPLSDGSKGITAVDLWDADAADPSVIETKKRNSLLQTFGNLTLIVQALNSSVSNSAWTVKKPALMAASLLPINLQLNSIDVWDEATILARSRDLLNRATQLWPGP